MNKEEIKEFYEHLKENLLPYDVTQESMGSGETLYTADDWTMEVCKCLLEDEEVHGTKHKQLMYKALQEVKDDADWLLVGEVGRGLDIVIAQMVKEWEWIICYDHNPIYEEYLNRYFYYDMTFHGVSSSYFLEEHHNMIKDKTIMILNHSKLRQFDVIRKNENIIHLIFDGELLW